MEDFDGNIVCVSWALDNPNKMQKKFTIDQLLDGHPRESCAHILSDRLIISIGFGVVVYDFQGQVLKKWDSSRFIYALQLISADELVELASGVSFELRSSNEKAGIKNQDDGTFFVTRRNIKTGERIGDIKSFSVEYLNDKRVLMKRLQMLSNGDLVIAFSDLVFAFPHQLIVVDGASLKVKKQFNGLFLRESNKEIVLLSRSNDKRNYEIQGYDLVSLSKVYSQKYMHTDLSPNFHVFNMMLPSGDMFIFLWNNVFVVERTYRSSFLVINKNGEVIASREDKEGSMSSLPKQVSNKAIAVFNVHRDKKGGSFLTCFLPLFMFTNTENQFLFDIKTLISAHVVAPIADLVLEYAGTENISREDFTYFINYLKKHLSDAKEFPSERAKADNLGFFGGLAVSIMSSSPLAKYDSLRTSTLKSLDNILTNLEKREIEFDTAISELLKVINDFRHALASDKGIYLPNFLKVLCMDKLFGDFADSLSPVMTSDDLAFLISYLRNNNMLLEAKPLSLAM